MSEWVSNLEYEGTGHSASFNQRLASNYRLILFDGRGCGLSDRQVHDFSAEARLRDLEAVVDALDLQEFVLFASSQSSPVGIMYAARHPERVSRLVLYASFSDQRVPSEKGLIRAMLDLIRAEWNVGARTTMNFVHPDADRDEEQKALEYLRASSTGEVAARILEEGFFNTDVTHLLPAIQCPTLVMHRRGDKAVPVECGRHVASLLPNARFVVLEGDHHLAFYGDTDTFLRTVDEFLGVESPEPAQPVAEPVTAGPPVTILFTDMEDSTATTGRLGDSEAQTLVREHNEIVRSALARYGGTEVKHTGDGIMASFPAASGGVECAIAIQRGMAQYNEHHPDGTIRVRIGLNSGEPVREQNDLFGTAVQLARRVCDLADPEQILVSNVVRELVAGKGFLFADHGETELRGFEDPVRVFEVRWQT
jgi:class 3 adenylate cyclase